MPPAFAHRLPVLQRTVTAWGAQVERAANTTVYHNTDAVAAHSIITGGIQGVTNEFGGGRLGKGFYTHVEIESAEVYGKKAMTLEFRTNRDVLGQVVPQEKWLGEVSTVSEENVWTNNDFLTAKEDTGELNFRSGDCLTFSRVKMGEAWYTREEYDELI